MPTGAVYTTPAGKAKVCYALSQPKARTPSNLKDLPGYMFVATTSPAEKVTDEMSLIMNFDLKEGVDHQAVMGRDQYVLVAKGKNLWVKNPAEEGKVLESMKRAKDLVVKGASAKGNATSDRYSLKASATPSTGSRKSAAEARHLAGEGSKQRFELVARLPDRLPLRFGSFRRPGKGGWEIKRNSLHRFPGRMQRSGMRPGTQRKTSRREAAPNSLPRSPRAKGRVTP